MKFDVSKSLQELENDDWGEPNYPSNLVRRCHELRRKPLKDLNAEDCRLLLGQDIGAPFVVPMALNFLAENPMESGVMYPGALLRNVLQLKAPFWEEHPDLAWEVQQVLFEIEALKKSIEDLAPETRQFQGVLDFLMGIKTKP